MRSVPQPLVEAAEGVRAGLPLALNLSLVWLTRLLSQATLLHFAHLVVSFSPHPRRSRHYS